MDKNKILKKLLPVAAMFLVAAGIGMTGATVFHKLTLENPIKTPKTQGKIEENLENKEVKILNNGEADVFVRVAYSETWIGKDDKDNTETILPATTTQATPEINTQYWEKGNDGWYYYKRVLRGSAVKGGNKGDTTQPFIKRVIFYPLTGPYIGAKYNLHVTMEVVQASNEFAVSKDAAEKLFQKTPSVDLASWGTNKYGCKIEWLDAPVISKPSDTSDSTITSN